MSLIYTETKATVAVGLSEVLVKRSGSRKRKYQQSNVQQYLVLPILRYTPFYKAIESVWK